MPVYVLKRIMDTANSLKSPATDEYQNALSGGIVSATLKQGPTNGYTDSEPGDRPSDTDRRITSHVVRRYQDISSLPKT